MEIKEFIKKSIWDYSYLFGSIYEIKHDTDKNCFYLELFVDGVREYIPIRLSDKFYVTDEVYKKLSNEQADYIHKIISMLNYRLKNMNVDIVGGKLVLNMDKETKELKEFIDNLNFDFNYLNSIADDGDLEGDDLLLCKFINLYNLNIRLTFYFNFTLDRELSTIKLFVEETKNDLHDIVVELPKDIQLIREEINNIFKNIKQKFLEEYKQYLEYDLNPNIEKVVI